MRRFLILLAYPIVALFSDKTAERWRCDYDLHDYCDGPPYEPWHFYTYRCDRCGKEFSI